MKRRNVVITFRADREIDEIERYWRKHRWKAPGLFLQELVSFLGLIAVDAEVAGTRWGRDPDVRRALMPRTLYHVYFLVLDDRIEILCVWGAVRRPPTF
jgi:hypothetical protein